VETLIDPTDNTLFKDESSRHNISTATKGEVDNTEVSYCPIVDRQKLCLDLLEQETK